MAAFDRMEEKANRMLDEANAMSQLTARGDSIEDLARCVSEPVMRMCGASTYRALFDNKDVTYRNTNPLLQPSSDSYYEGANGLKTGSYNDLKCLVASAEINGKSYVAAIMQGSDTGRYADAKTLFDYVAGTGEGEEASIDTSSSDETRCV